MRPTKKKTRYISYFGTDLFEIRRLFLRDCTLTEYQFRKICRVCLHQVMLITLLWDTNLFLYAEINSFVIWDLKNNLLSEELRNLWKRICVIRIKLDC